MITIGRERTVDVDGFGLVRRYAFLSLAFLVQF
jgi:hypothetical protein